MGMKFSELKRHEPLQKVVAHSLEMALYQVSVIINNVEYYVTEENGEFVKEVNFSEEQSNKDNVVIGNKLIFKDCALSPNYDPGTTITVDIDKKVIKITEPDDSIEYYDVKTNYGDLIVSSNIKFATGISDKDLEEIRNILSMELKLDTDKKVVAITWDLLPGSGEMYNFFKNQFKSGKMERSVSSKCILKNL